MLIDDAIVVRENIVRHMERGEDRITAARNGTAEIGLRGGRDHVLDHRGVRAGGLHGRWRGRMVPAVRGDRRRFGAGQPLHLVHARPDAVGLLGRSRPRRRTSESDADSGNSSSASTTWFDHQADRYGNVISWALHHRRWMAAFAVLSLIVALTLQVTVGGSRIPAQVRLRHDRGRCAHALERQPRIRARQGRARRDARARDTRNQEHRQQRQPGRRARLGGYRQAKRSATVRPRRSPATLREKLKQLVGAEYVVLDDLNNGAQKPVQIRSTVRIRASSWRSPTSSWRRMRNIPGAVDVGLSEQEPKDELRIELDRGLANQLGISVGDAAQTLRVAFAGVEVGDWVDPIGESRDVAVRLHPDDRVDASNIEHLPVPVAGTNMMVPLEQIANDHDGQGSGADPAPQWQAHGDRVRQRRRVVGRAK